MVCRAENRSRDAGEITLFKVGNSFTLIARGTNEDRRVGFKAAYRQPIVHRAGDKVFVIGTPNGTSYETVVVDLLAGSVTDRFDCLLPSISPNGRFVAFVKWFPGHFVRDVEWHYMLYDSTKTAIQNRPPGTVTPDAVNVGKPLYPTNVDNKQGDNFNLDRPVHEAAMDSFFWSPDSSRLVFADKHDRVMSLVMVRPGEVHQGAVSVRIPDLCQASETSNCDFQLKSVNFDDVARKMRVLFRGVRAQAGNTVTREFAYGQFGIP